MGVKRIWMLALIVAGLTGVAIAGIRSYCTRPNPLCGIPTRDYQFRPRSPSKTALSRPVLLLTGSDDEGQTIKEIKRYQLDPAELVIDHCAISAMELQIHDNGVWVLSLTATQNVQADGEASPAVTEEGLRTAHLKRNEFVIKLRCYGGYGDGTARADTPVTRPVLFELDPVHFWVQRGETRHYRKEGYVNCQKRLRDLVDRVELEFYYH